MKEVDGNLVAILGPTNTGKTYVAFDRLKNSDLSINNKCIVSPKAYNKGGSRTFLEIDRLFYFCDERYQFRILSSHQWPFG